MVRNPTAKAGGLGLVDQARLPDQTQPGGNTLSGYDTTRSSKTYRRVRVPSGCQPAALEPTRLSELHGVQYSVEFGKVLSRIIVEENVTPTSRLGGTRSSLMGGCTSWRTWTKPPNQQSTSRSSRVPAGRGLLTSPRLKPGVSRKEF